MIRFCFLRQRDFFAVSLFIITASLYRDYRVIFFDYLHYDRTFTRRFVRRVHDEAWIVFFRVKNHAVSAVF